MDPQRLSNVQRYCRDLVTRMQSGPLDVTPIVATMLSLISVLADELKKVAVMEQVRLRVWRVFRVARDMDTRRN